MRATCRCAEPGAPPGRMKFFERPDHLVQLVDQRLERVDVARLDLRDRPLALVLFEEAQVRAEVEQLVLDRRQRRRQARHQAVRQRHADRRVQLVDRCRRRRPAASPWRRAGRRRGRSSRRRPCACRSSSVWACQSGPGGRRSYFLTAPSSASMVAFDGPRAFWSRWATASAAFITRSTLRPAIFCTSSSRVAAAQQLGEESRVLADVLEPGDDVGDAVEVAADADVIDAGDLADVIDVVGDLRQRRLRARDWPCRHASSAAVTAAGVDCGSAFSARALAPRAAGGAARPRAR